MVYHPPVWVEIVFFQKEPKVFFSWSTVAEYYPFLRLGQIHLSGSSARSLRFPLQALIILSIVTRSQKTLREESCLAAVISDNGLSSADTYSFCCWTDDHHLDARICVGWKLCTSCVFALPSWLLRKLWRRKFSETETSETVWDSLLQLKCFAVVIDCREHVAVPRQPGPDIPIPWRSGDENVEFQCQPMPALASKDGRLAAVLQDAFERTLPAPAQVSINLTSGSNHTRVRLLCTNHRLVTFCNS